jgi:hypothetical protein
MNNTTYQQKLHNNASSQQFASSANFYQLLSKAANGKLALKILDVMLLSEEEGEKRPWIWLFTDTKGFFNSRPLKAMGIDELIKAIIMNIEGSHNNITHTDILVRKR